MKILFLAYRDSTHPLSAGGDIIASGWAKFLAYQGHEVTYVCSSYQGCMKEENVDGVKVVRLASGLFFSLTALMYYVKRCRGQFDLVYEDVIGGAKIPLFAPLYVKEPMIADWHQRNRLIFLHQFPHVFLPLLEVLERLLAWLHRRTTIRVPSPETARQLAQLGLPSENIRVIPPSIPDSWADITFESIRREPLIVWLNKIRRYKCPHFAIQAMPLVLQQCPGARLVIAGRREDVKYENRLRELAANLRIADRVEIVTNIDESEKKELLMRARVMVMTSPIEGFGIVALEAAACGVPVVASEGVPESTVKHGYNGLRVPFGDAKALSQAILRILKDDELFHTLSQNGLSFMKDFTWTRVSERFEKLVQETARAPKDNVSTR